MCKRQGTLLNPFLLASLHKTASKFQIFIHRAFFPNYLFFPSGASEAEGGCLHLKLQNLLSSHWQGVTWGKAVLLGSPSPSHGRLQPCLWLLALNAMSQHHFRAVCSNRLASALLPERQLELSVLALH